MSHTYVLAGRFQPFHNGHLQMLDQVVATHPGAEIVLAVVTDTSLGKGSGHPFEAASKEHQEPQRNPFTPTQVLAMVTALASQRYAGLVLPTLLPRPNPSSWPVICRLLPSQRTWVVASEGEAWDLEKAQFLREQGDEVELVARGDGARGGELRDALVAQNYDKLETGLPAEVWQAMQSVLSPKQQ